MNQQSRKKESSTGTSFKGQVNLVVALPAEAKPIIEHFELREMATVPYRIFFNVDKTLWLIISGVGTDASAAATAFLCQCSAADRNTAWLNLGIGGHKILPVAKAVLARKIIETRTGRCWCPALLFEPPCELAVVRTVDRPVEGYPTAEVYEMEAAGFYATACELSDPRTVYVIKIISDNQSLSAGQISAAKVTQLIRDNLGVIGHTLDALRQLQYQSVLQSVYRDQPPVAPVEVKFQE